MTRVIKHSTAGEQGRLYSRRPPETAAKSAAAAPAPPPVPPAVLVDQLGPAYAADAAGEISYCNSAFVDLARHLYGVRPGPDGRPATPPRLKAQLDAIDADGHLARETLEVRVGGTVRHYTARHFPLRDDAGGRTGYAGYFEDVTRRQLAERQIVAIQEKLNDIVRTTADWVWETDAAFRITHVSPRIAAITGVPPDYLIGQPLLELGELPPPPADVPDLPALMAARRPFRNRLLLMRDELGAEHRTHLSGTPMFERDSGAFVGYRGTGADVSATVESERSAVEAKHELEGALKALERRNAELHDTLESARSLSEAKSEFLALTSHELRTPLNAIIGFAELCRREIAGPLGERYLSYVDNILSASAHLVQLIDNLLDSVRIENRSIALEAGRVAVAPLIAETVRMVEMRARDADIILIAPPADAALAIRGDATAVRQIVLNLLTNAIKFTPTAGTVGIEAGTDENANATITVWDTGVGIAADQQHAVFERFTRLRADLSAGGTDGIGIGLHVARQLTELMGGEITLESEIDRGSRFTVHLPAWTGEAPAEAPAPSGAQAHPNRT